MIAGFAIVLMHLAIYHLICDRCLQPGWLSRGKRSHTDEGRNGAWVFALSAHAYVHAIAVVICTGSAALGVCELVAHWVIDLGKSRGCYRTGIDQALHAACKVAWALVLVMHRA